MARMLSPDEHQRIAAAIRDAESRTSGEIYCVVARSSDGYFFPAAFLALASILAFSFFVAIALEHWWVAIRLPWFVAMEVAASVSVLAVLWRVASLRILLVPHRLRYRAAHDNALKQFLARNVHRTVQRTGVLVFVSLEERYAEVVADSGINQKVAQQDWNGIVAGLAAAARSDRLAEGFVAAIGAVGALLETHFPVRAGDIDELDDHLVEI